MKTFRFSILMFATLVTMSMLFSCGKSADGAGVVNVLNKVPSDAAAVAVVNVGQMMKKVDYNELKKTEMFKRLLSELKSPDMEKILDNPEASGIATNNQFCMFVDAKGKEDFIVNFLLPIKSVKDLEAWFDKLSKNEKSPFKEVQKSGDYKYVLSKDQTDKVGLAWDKKVIVFSYAQKSDLKSSFDKIFDSKRKESIMTNKNFLAERSEKHDVMFWVQSNPLVKIAKSDDKFSSFLVQLAFMGLSEKSLDDNSIAFFYDFNKGEMEGGISYKMNKDLEKEFGIIFKNKISTDFSSIFPKNNLTGMTMLGLELKGLKKILENRGVIGFVDGQLNEMGFSVDEIINGLSGEVAMGFYADPASQKVDDTKVILAVSFNQPELFEKLVNNSKKLGLEIKKSGNRYMNSRSKIAQAVMVGKILVLSNDLAALDKIEKGGYNGNEALEKNHYAEMSKGWLSGHIDYNQAIAAAGSKPFERMTGLAGLKVLQEYNVLESTTAVATTSEAKVMVYLKDKNENSLKTVSKLMSRIYQDREKIQKEMDLNMPKPKDETPVTKKPGKDNI
jgi:hypothetical protein